MCRLAGLDEKLEINFRGYVMCSTWSDRSKSGKIDSSISCICRTDILIYLRIGNL